MLSRVSIVSKRALVILMTMATLLGTAPPASAAKPFNGRWVFTVTIPESPTSGAKRTFTVNLDVSPRDESLHGRLTITDAEGHTVSGAWRQVGKNISVTYELPCPSTGDASCGSLILLGKMKSSNTVIKKGNVIVMWDTPNDQNPALYDTSNGSFSGTRLSQ
jgi:hypothetical protein